MKLQNLSYKILFSILFFALAGIVFFLKIGGKTQKVSAAWWNSTWSYRKSITITNTSGSDKTNTLVKVLDNYDLSSLVSASKLQSDLDDLRFTDNNDNLISHWTQDNTSNSADVWVVIPSIPSSGTTIWIYYGNSSASSTSTPFYSYSGTSEFIDDSSGNFRIKFKSSGTLAPSASISIDAFLVGGGGGGGSGTAAGSGGGGGYAGTWTNIALNTNQGYSIVVGGGGGPNAAGGVSSAFGYSKNGGNPGSGAASYKWQNTTGGAGGSGGGGNGAFTGSIYRDAGNGGSNGSNGYPGSDPASAGGAGQGTSTEEFGVSGQTKYGPGGGGGCYLYTKLAGIGGITGGGNGYGTIGGGSYVATSGTANTGGGGGGSSWGGAGGAGSGGSGIVIIKLIPISTISINSNEELYVYVPNNCRISESTNDTQLTVLWSDTNTNENNYLVQKSTNGGAWTDLNYSAQNSTSYADTSISTNNSYQYRISPYVTDSTNFVWCYTPTLNLGQGNFNIEGLDLEGINID